MVFLYNGSVAKTTGLKIVRYQEFHFISISSDAGIFGRSVI